jgi:hypothetical protein
MSGKHQLGRVERPERKERKAPLPCPMLELKREMHIMADIARDADMLSEFLGKRVLIDVDSTFNPILATVSMVGRDFVKLDQIVCRIEGGLLARNVTDFVEGLIERNGRIYIASYVVNKSQIRGITLAKEGKE